MYQSKRYWEIQKVRYTYWGKKYVKYVVSHVLDANGIIHKIYFITYASRYGAINWCRRENAKHNEDTEIIVNDNVIEENKP